MSAAPTGGYADSPYVLKKPFADLISYSKLVVLELEYHHLSELYMRVLETTQLIQSLEKAMVCLEMVITVALQCVSYTPSNKENSPRNDCK